MFIDTYTLIKLELKSQNLISSKVVVYNLLHNQIKWLLSVATKHLSRAPRRTTPIFNHPRSFCSNHIYFHIGQTSYLSDTYWWIDFNTLILELLLLNLGHQHYHKYNENQYTLKVLVVMTSPHTIDVICSILIIRHDDNKG